MIICKPGSVTPHAPSNISCKGDAGGGGVYIMYVIFSDGSHKSTKLVVRK